MSRRFAPLFAQEPREPPAARPVDPTAARAVVGPAPQRAESKTEPRRVVIVGLEIPFWDLVLLNIQLLFAAIPAAAIVLVIFWLVRRALNS